MRILLYIIVLTRLCDRVADVNYAPLSSAPLAMIMCSYALFYCVILLLFYYSSAQQSLELGWSVVG